MTDVTQAEIEQLIQLLVESEEYHYIIIDQDSLVHAVTKAVLQKSDQIIWLLNNDLQSFQKKRASCLVVSTIYLIRATKLRRGLFLL